MTDTSRLRHPMTPPSRNPEQKRHKATDFAKQREIHKAAVFQEMQTERVLSDAKTAKLRALRLAKEEADREAVRAARGEDTAENKTSGRDD
jgi:hypothetical protein